MNCDRIAFQRAEGGLSIVLKTDPFCHLRPPGAVEPASFECAASSTVALDPVTVTMHCIIGRAADVCYTLPGNTPRRLANSRSIMRGCDAGPPMVETRPVESVDSIGCSYLVCRAAEGRSAAAGGSDTGL